MAFDQPTDVPMQQVCAVAYRRTDAGLEFCLITSLKGRWSFPKGIIDPGETPHESALKEAHEEAGLSGEIEGEPLGSFHDFKWNRVLNVTGYLMRVTAAAETWQEAAQRQREWVSSHEALERLEKSKQLPLLKMALKRLTK